MTRKVVQMIFESGNSVSVQRKTKKSSTHKPRHYFSSAEVEEIEKIFKSFLEAVKCPSRAEIKKGQKISEKNGGLLHKLECTNIMKKISNMNKKAKND